MVRHIVLEPAGAADRNGEHRAQDGVDGAAEAARGAAAGGLKRGEGLEAGGSPVHSKSLTATYFPGALRNPENRARTVSPEAAAAAVRAGLHRGENQ